MLKLRSNVKDTVGRCFVILILVGVIYGSDHPKVLLVSYDGFRWDYLNKISNPVNFNRIINKGVSATKGLKNAYITKTLPNHYTLVTGLYEESHGLIANEMYDPVFNESFSLEKSEDVIKSKWFGGEPIWVTNQKQSTSSSPRRSGSMFWPGSMASVHGYLPTKYFPYNPSIKLEERIDIIISWFLDKDPINLGLLYYEHPDHEGHEFGPDSENMTAALEYLDKATGYLLHSLQEKKLLDKVNLILTSDHGMMSTPKNKLIILEDYIKGDLYEKLVMNSPIVHILQRNGMYITYLCFDGMFLRLSRGNWNAVFIRLIDTFIYIFFFALVAVIHWCASCVNYSHVKFAQDTCFQ